MIFFVKKVDELIWMTIFFWVFLDHGGPSIQSGFDKRVAIFDAVESYFW